MKPRTEIVVGYIEREGISVSDWLALEIPDNLEVAAQDPADLLDHYKRLDLAGIDALVLSACVQMPSLASVQKIEDAIGLPVVSTAICTAHRSEEHTSELQSLMRISYAVFCLKKKTTRDPKHRTT